MCDKITQDFLKELGFKFDPKALDMNQKKDKCIYSKNTINVSTTITRNAYMKIEEINYAYGNPHERVRGFKKCTSNVFQ